MNNTNNQTTKDLYGLGDYNSNQIKSFAELFDAENISPNMVYDRRPDAAPSPGQYIRSMDIEAIPCIIPDAFAGDIGLELIQNLNIQQLEKIGAESDAYLKQAIKITLIRALQQTLSPQIKNNLLRIQNYIQYSPAWQ